MVKGRAKQYYPVHEGKKAEQGNSIREEGVMDQIQHQRSHQRDPPRHTKKCALSSALLCSQVNQVDIIKFNQHDDTCEVYQEDYLHFNYLNMNLSLHISILIGQLRRLLQTGITYVFKTLVG